MIIAVGNTICRYIVMTRMITMTRMIIMIRMTKMMIMMIIVAMTRMLIMIRRIRIIRMIIMIMSMILIRITSVVIDMINSNEKMKLKLETILCTVLFLVITQFRSHNDTNKNAGSMNV